MENSVNRSIIRRLQLVFGISLFILLISSFASFVSMQRLIENSRLIAHTDSVILNSENMMSYAKDGETGQRGFLVTRNPIFLQPYNNAYDKVLNAYSTIKQMTKDNPVQQKNLGQAKVLIDDRFRHLQKIIDLYNSRIYVSDSVNSAEMLIGKQLMDSLRMVVADIQSEEKRLLEIRTSEQTKYISYTPILLLFAAIISIIITLISYSRVKRDMDQRLEEQRAAAEKYIETNKRISVMEQVTRQIAEGNYAVRSEDNKADELGRISNALNEMVVVLEDNFNALAKRTWLQEGAVKIGDAIRGKKRVDEIANAILETLVTYLNAPVATLYVADDHLNLKLTSSYAASGVAEYIRIGEGLVGQAVKNKKIVTLNNLPDNYLSVSSSIGKTKPVNVVIVPLIYSSEVIGAIELGFLKALSQLELDLLENNKEAMSIGVNAMLNLKRIQGLLEETQAQAEELQAQHSELENLNTELEAQAQKLQASEEELKVQQEELLQTNQELEENSRSLEEKNQLIIERNYEIQKKAEELAISTKYKSEFLANMSHELRTPLNSILLLSRLMAENNEKNLSNEQIEYARVIQSSGNGLLSLIDEILDLSKIEAGKMSLEFNSVTVAEIVNDMKILFDPIANEKRLEFKLSVEDDVVPVLETDKMRLEQILKNLLSNALKFTSKGYVSLAISMAADNKDMMCFKVKDTGIGIPKEKQQLIFEAFQQADGSTRRKYGGTGLGLSISRELVRLLGGDIQISSEPDSGSEFMVMVPVTKELLMLRQSIREKEEAIFAPSDDEDEMPEIKELKNRSHFVSSIIPESIPDDRNDIKDNDKVILIVEDDTNFAKSLLDYTRKKGYKGVVSVRGDEALGLAKYYMPTGILLDIQLPIKSGWEAMEELKADKQTRHIPVHIMSSYEMKNESLLKGAVDFINKPVAFEKMQEIFQKIEYVINRETKKVLIVEENAKHAKALAYFLENLDISTEIKNSVSDGINALTSDDIDCVILDMGIPDAKSYETLEEVKKNPGLEDLPIIIFTGKSLSKAEEQRIKQYADSIVVKTAHSYQRIMDEVSLFLHLVEDNETSTNKNGKHKKLGGLREVLKNKTVLIADDDVRNIFSLTKALETLDMNVITAIDGKDALQKLEENSDVDVVLMDMMMPELDGYQTTTRIRQNPKYRNLPVIAVTAKAMSGDREKCINAGASDYITKPVDIDQLFSLLRVWLYDKSI